MEVQVLSPALDIYVLFCIIAIGEKFLSFPFTIM